MQVDISQFVTWVKNTPTPLETIYERTCRIMDAATERQEQGIHLEPRYERPCAKCGIPLGQHSQAGNHCPDGVWFSKTARYEAIQ